jgi:DNA topoisomerase-1
LVKEVYSVLQLTARTVIAWHLKDALKLTVPFRVTYTEVIDVAIKKVIDSPRKIDMDLVQAQEGVRF